MMNTSRFELPLIAASQAQKHVTVNEALVRADAMINLVLEEPAAVVPPVAPAEGSCYGIGHAATGAFTGHDGKIALFSGGGWQFLPTRVGLRAWNLASSRLEAFDGSLWRPMLDRVERVGINTDSSNVNRLAVASAASLFTADGVGSHRVVVNKAASTGTASLTFQTNFSGRAEIGTTGSDALSFKVSADGSAWREAMVISPAGNIGIGTNAPIDKLHVQGENLAFTVQNTATAQYNVASFSLRGPDSLGTQAQTRFVQGNSNTGATQGYFSISNYGATGTFVGNLLLYEYASQVWTVATNNVGRLQIDAASTRPAADNAYTLGSSGRRWSQIWAVSGTIQTSDRRDKEDIAPLPVAAAAEIVRSVEPVFYRWRERVREVSACDSLSGDIDTTSLPGARIHAGFLAQDVKAALDMANVCCAVWGRTDAADDLSREWLRPDQLIPFLWAAVRELQGRVTAFEAR